MPSRKAEDAILEYANLVEGTVDCPPNCEHTPNDANCALDAWVAAGKADARRLASYRRLLSSRAGDDPREGDAYDRHSEIDPRDQDGSE